MVASWPTCKKKKFQIGCCVSSVVELLLSSLSCLRRPTKPASMAAAPRDLKAKPLPRNAATFTRDAMPPEKAAVATAETKASQRAAMAQKLHAPPPPGVAIMQDNDLAPTDRGGKTVMMDPTVNAWRSNGLDFNTPSMLAPNSSYQKFLRETKRGTVTTPNGERPIGEVYVPPWEKTLSEVYGKGTVGETSHKTLHDLGYGKEKGAR
jgi:hypothetical protein